jgi:hypothetical protein
MVSHDDEVFRSVLTDLDLAINCCASASSAADKPSRNIRNATKAYSDGLYFLFGAALSREAKSRVLNQLALLDSKLRELGV